jgi:hypothetical protein
MAQIISVSLLLSVRVYQTGVFSQSQPTSYLSGLTRKAERYHWLGHGFFHPDFDL